MAIKTTSLTPKILRLLANSFHSWRKGSRKERPVKGESDHLSPLVRDIFSFQKQSVKQSVLQVILLLILFYTCRSAGFRGRKYANTIQPSFFDLQNKLLAEMCLAKSSLKCGYFLRWFCLFMLLWVRLGCAKVWDLHCDSVRFSLNDGEHS